MELSKALISWKLKYDVKMALPQEFEILIDLCESSNSIRISRLANRQKKQTKCSDRFRPGHELPVEIASVN